MKKKIALILIGTLTMMSLMACSSDDSASGLVSGFAKTEGTMADYMNLEVTEVDLIEVTDEDIQTALDTLSNANAQTSEATEGAVAEGDIVNIDYIGYLDDVAFDGGTADSQLLEIGSGSYIDGFEEGLIGVEVGETVSLDLKFDDDYYSTDLAGQEVVFEITVNSIVTYVYPEVTDELIQEVSDTCTTVEEYEAELRATYEAENLATQETSRKTVIWSALVENTVIDEYDEDYIQETVDYISGVYEYQAYYYYGWELEEFISAMGLTTDEFDEYVLIMAQQQYTSDVIVSYIAVEEGLIPSDEEYQEYIDSLYTMYGYTDEETFLTDMDMSREEVELEYLTEIVLEWMLDVVTYVAAEDTEEVTE